MSKYISLVECRIPGLRHGMGAVKGALVGDWMLPHQLMQKDFDLRRDTCDAQEFPHERWWENNLFQHGGFHRHRMTFVQHLLDKLFKMSVHT
jgi:hypothetical protein